ncbi:hypothetical protein [Borreliella garinii]|uniref:hypothetical protein n=1 Tax=Borreliella garinii TaxID=29519 RepID=UPI001F2E8E3C|nr:hypothetical protein [Borreliella garinii]
MNLTDKKNIDTKKRTNTTLCIKKNSRIIVKDYINNQELFKVKSKRRYDFKAMLLGIKTALKVINIGNNNKLGSIKKHKDHTLLEFKDNKIYLIQLSELKKHLLKNKKTIIRESDAGKRRGRIYR